MKEYSQYLPLALIGVAFLKSASHKYLYTVRFEGRTFLPDYLRRCMHGIWRGNADLRKCRESSSFRICNCYSGASRWNDEKAVSRYNASVSMLSGEIVRMDFCGCGSRQQMPILI